MKIRIVLTCLAAAAALLTGTAPAGASSQSDLAKLRATNNAFHNIARAEQGGFSVLADQKGITCIDMPGMGGMGVHWV